MLSGSAAARVKPLQRRRFDENLSSTGSVDLHAGEERQERVRAHRNDRVVVECDERRVLLRGEAEALGIGYAVREIVGAPIRVMREAVERFNQPDQLRLDRRVMQSRRRRRPPHQPSEA